MILGISKLSDPEKTNSNENLSLAFVVALAKKKQLKCLPEIIKKYEECIKSVKNIRKYRSKIIGHLDLQQIEKHEIKVTLDEIENAFAYMEEILNLYNYEVENITWIFDLMGGQDIGSLFYHLEQSLIYDYVKKERNDIMKDEEEYKNWNNNIRPTTISS